MRGIGRDVDGDVDVVGEDRRVCLGESGWFWRRGVNGVGLGERMGNGGGPDEFCGRRKDQAKKGNSCKATLGLLLRYLPNSVAPRLILVTTPPPIHEKESNKHNPPILPHHLPPNN